MNELDNILHEYGSISLQEMSQVRLMNRIDTKFVATQSQLVRLLEMASDEYRVQDVGGVRDLPYYTCYFDTPDCDMFVQHQRGRKVRQKIRFRLYENSGTAFLEIKNKNNHGRTDKKRISIVRPDADIMPYSDFINAHSQYMPENLVSQLQNRFNRITMVNCKMTERLTIDTGLCFQNMITKCEVSLHGLVIIELKRDGNTCSPASDMLHRMHIQPSGFSKYCVGSSLTNRLIKQNRLKPRLRLINKLMQSERLQIQ